MMRYLDYFTARVSTLLFLLTIIDRIIPYTIKTTITKYYNNILNYFNPHVQITFDDHSSGCFSRSRAYVAIHGYLAAKFRPQARRLRGESRFMKNGAVKFSVDDFEAMTDVYEGVKVSWVKTVSVPRCKIISKDDHVSIERRAYVLRFRRQDRDFVVRAYLKHVFSEGRRGNSEHLKHTNYSLGPIDDAIIIWRCGLFDQPATFDTLAMDPGKKKEIMDDLVKFTEGKEYYRRIGKPWKRSYLLYGPPGSGKSTMIYAMANFLGYDVYDLELTSVRSNTDLRKLVEGLFPRTIVVIEDIDCSLPITGRRSKARNKNKSDDEDSKEDDKKNKSKVTLSGLLNFMDGLWSATGGGRIFVITTNHKEKLDPALIRPGRMDRHIEMSYCCYEAFKVLAKNYLDLDSHEKFEEIRRLLSETEMSPADVAENLTPKSAGMNADIDCLENLIAALRKLKEEGEKKEVGNTETDPESKSDTDTETDSRSNSTGGDADSATELDI